MGVPTPSITWFQDGNVVEGAIFQFLYFPSVRPEDRGLYYCEAKNSEGTVESNTALLNLDGVSLFVMCFYRFYTLKQKEMHRDC